MRYLALLCGFFFISANSYSTEHPNLVCASNKYHRYVDASISWYESLVSRTIHNSPELSDVAQWFLNARKQHFKFNAKAFDYYLERRPQNIHFNQAVESWLNLSQNDIQVLSEGTSPLADSAKLVFDFRQQKVHKSNYALRAAFADLLSNPEDIQSALSQYNLEIQRINQLQCDLIS